MHGGYYAQDLRNSGVTVTDRDIARSLDGGHTNIDGVVDSAPETETDADSERTSGGIRGGTRRSSKDEKIRAAELQEFERLRPQLVKRWKRRIRIPFSLWARLANDPAIALSDDEVEEGAEMHVDLCLAMGWLKAGKIEAIMDTIMWWGASGLSRSQAGKDLLGIFNPQRPNPPNTTVQ